MERCLVWNLLSALCSRVCGVSFALEESALCWPSLSTTCLFFLVVWGNGLRSELCFHEVFALCWPKSSPRVASEATQSCLTLCNPMDCSLPDSSVHGIFQARVLEWVAISFSRGIFPTQGSNLGFLHCRQMLYHLSHRGSHLPRGNALLLVTCPSDSGAYRTVFLCFWAGSQPFWRPPSPCSKWTQEGVGQSPQDLSSWIPMAPTHSRLTHPENDV